MFGIFSIFNSAVIANESRTAKQNLPWESAALKLKFKPPTPKMGRTQRVKRFATSVSCVSWRTYGIIEKASRRAKRSHLSWQSQSSVFHPFGKSQRQVRNASGRGTRWPDDLALYCQATAVGNPAAWHPLCHRLTQCLLVQSTHRLNPNPAPAPTHCPQRAVHSSDIWPSGALPPLPLLLVLRWVFLAPSLVPQRL